MPTITPTVRAVIGGSPEDFRQPRASVKAATGMGLPPLKESKPAELGTDQPQSPQKTGQPNTTEETTTPAAVTLSPQLTALARKQQKLQQEIQAQREREAEWAKKEADFIPRSSLKDKLHKSVAETLQELGTSYEELTNLQLAQLNGVDPLQQLEAKVESKFQQIEKKQEESVNKQYEATLKQYRAEVDSLISADAKAFHFINKKKCQDAVVEHIVETWKENPDQVLTVDQAAKEIEEFLREEAKAAADALKELEPAEETPAQQKKLPPPKAGAPRTLTNQVETTPQRTYGQFQHLSMKERIAQAIARAQK